MITKIKKNRNKKSYRFPFLSVLFGFLALLIIGFLIFSNINIAQRRAELTGRIEVLRKEIQVLKEENQRLEAEIKRAKQKDFLEEKAREGLGLKRPGEEVVIISPIEKEIKEPVEERKDFWEKIWKKLRF
jgi:cell division protein FtsL